jgi:hypothetical protein
MDGETIAALRRLAEQAESAAEEWTPESDGKVSSRYAALREQAWTLASRNGWGAQQSFSNEFPSVEQLALIHAFDHAWDLAGTSEAARLTGTTPPVQRALRALAAWAIGARMAGELHL